MRLINQPIVGLFAIIDIGRKTINLAAVKLRSYFFIEESKSSERYLGFSNRATRAQKASSSDRIIRSTAAI